MLSKFRRAPALLPALSRSQSAYKAPANKPTKDGIIQDDQGLPYIQTLHQESWKFKPQFEFNKKAYPLYGENASYADVRHYPETQVTTLSNGLRVATENSPWNTRSVSVGVFVDVGSRYEDDNNNGTAHFLEHLAFKGTKNRTREALEREIEDMGGHLNAYTSREQTVYYAQVLKHNTDKAVDILSDIICNSNYDADAIERERSVILQEMENVYKTTKEELIFDHLHENCFQDCDLGRTILGPVENVKKINRDDIVKFVDHFYTSDRMVVVGTGAIDHDSFVKMCQDKFGHITSRPPDRKVIKDSSWFRGCDYDERWDEMDTVYAAVAYPTVGWDHPDSYPLMFMQQILGQWDQKIPGGRYQPNWLTRRLYEDNDRPVCKNYMAFNTPYSDIGLFGVYAAFHPYEFNVWGRLVRKQMNRLGTDVSDGEIEDVRERLKATMLLNLGNSPQVLEEIGRQLLVHNKRIHPADAFARIDDVDKVAIRVAGQKYLIDRDHAMIAVGPTFEFPEYFQFRDYSYKIY